MPKTTRRLFLLGTSRYRPVPRPFLLVSKLRTRDLQARLSLTSLRFHPSKDDLDSLPHISVLDPRSMIQFQSHPLDQVVALPNSNQDRLEIPSFLDLTLVECGLSSI